MSIKGFPSQKKSVTPIAGYADIHSLQSHDFVTVQNIGSDKRGLDSAMYGVYTVSANKVIEATSTNRVIKCTSHGARVGDIARFVDGDNVAMSVGIIGVPDANTFILATELIDAPTAGELFDLQRYILTRYTSDGSQIVTVTEDYLDVVDQIDTTPLLSVAVTNIPKSSSLPVQVVASLAADTKKLIIVEDIGEFIGLYTGAAASEVLKAVLPLGGGEFDLELMAGTRVSLRHMKDTDITSDYISINFLG